jgi:hypothetical protein
MKTFNSLIAFLFIAGLHSNVNGQKRIGMDLSTKGNNLVISAHYNQIIRNNYFYSVGLFGGGFGYSGVDLTRTQFDSGRRLKSPFEQINESESDNSGNTYELFDYGTKGSGLGIQVGFGYFHEFSVVHGIRFNLNNRFGWMTSKLSVSYYNDALKQNINRFERVSHFTGAVSPEVYHTMRWSGRITFFYGLRLPYFYSVNKENFNPQNTKDLFNSWEPEVAAGLTYVIGKCD